MNYEKAKELLKKDMNERNYAADTQNKFVRALQGLCKYSNKLNDVSTIDYSDTKKFLDYLITEKQFGASTVNNYQAAIKFLFVITLKKPWNDAIFPYLKLSKESDKKIKAKSIYSNNPIKANLTYTEALHSLIIEMELRGFATGSKSSYLRCIKKFLEFTQKQIIHWS